MNTQELKKNVGELFRLRPRPVLVRRLLAEVSVLTSDGPRLKKEVVETDYDWRLEQVTGKGVLLYCLHTSHQFTLGADNVREYRSPNFLMLKCQLILDGDEVRIEPS